MNVGISIIFSDFQRKTNENTLTATIKPRYNQVMTTETNKTYSAPLFKNLSDARLIEEYKGYRALAYNNAAMAASGATNRQKGARSMGYLMKNIEIIEAIAKKRDLSLI